MKNGMDSRYLIACVGQRGSCFLACVDQDKHSCRKQREGRNVDHRRQRERFRRIPLPLQALAPLRLVLGPLSHCCRLTVA